MPADNTAQLIIAARARRAAVLARVEAVLRRAERDGLAITVTEISRRAEVSRAWLYAETDLRERIDRLRRADPDPDVGGHTRPDQRASLKSLRHRLDIAHARVRTLTADNTRLRDELAHARGQLREDAAAHPR